MVCHEPCFRVTIAEALTAVWCLVLVPVYSALAYYCRKVLDRFWPSICRELFCWDENACWPNASIFLTSKLQCKNLLGPGNNGAFHVGTVESDSLIHHLRCWSDSRRVLEPLQFIQCTIRKLEVRHLSGAFWRSELEMSELIIHRF